MSDLYAGLAMLCCVVILALLNALEIYVRKQDVRDLQVQIDTINHRDKVTARLQADAIKGRTKQIGAVIPLTKPEQKH